MQEQTAREWKRSSNQEAGSVCMVVGKCSLCVFLVGESTVDYGNDSVFIHHCFPPVLDIKPWNQTIVYWFLVLEADSGAGCIGLDGRRTLKHTSTQHFYVSSLEDKEAGPTDFHWWGLKQEPFQHKYEERNNVLIK